MSRDRMESVVMQADDSAELQTALDALRAADWDNEEKALDDVRRAAVIRYENRRTIEDLLAMRGINVSLPVCFGD